MSDTEARRAHWDRIYADRTPLEVSWYQKEPGVSLALVANSGAAFDDAIIDVGGGASVLADNLLLKGFSRVSVLDISANAIARARQRLGDRAKDVEWHVADITCFRPPHRYALWHDRAVFHFLTDPADRRAYLRVLKAALEPNGQVIIAAFAIGGPARCSGLEIVQYDAEKLGAELGEQFELVEQTSEIHLTPAKAEQQFAWFRFVRTGAL